MRHGVLLAATLSGVFPFLFGRAFIEAIQSAMPRPWASAFPFLFGGAFIEAWLINPGIEVPAADFPSFMEGLSLRCRRMDTTHPNPQHFPSFSEGLSIRQINIPPDDRGPICSAP